MYFKHKNFSSQNLQTEAMLLVCTLQPKEARAYQCFQQGRSRLLQVQQSDKSAMLPYQYHLTTIESLSSHTAVKEQFTCQIMQVILGNKK